VLTSKIWWSGRLAALTSGRVGLTVLGQRSIHGQAPSFGGRHYALRIDRARERDAV